MPIYPQEPNLITWLKKLEQRVMELERANPLIHARIPEGGIRTAVGAFLKSEDFDGDLDTMSPGTKGWAFGGAEDGAVINNLALRGGIIGNDALSNPVQFASYGANAVNFPVPPGAGADLVTGSIAVPDGFTRAVVLCHAGVSAGETNGNVDFLYVSAHINGTGAGPLFNQPDTNSWTSVSVMSIRSLSGLSGGSISLSCHANTQEATWAAGAANNATLDAIAIFLR